MFFSDALKSNPLTNVLFHAPTPRAVYVLQAIIANYRLAYDSQGTFHSRI